MPGGILHTDPFPAVLANSARIECVNRGLPSEYVSLMVRQQASLKVAQQWRPNRSREETISCVLGVFKGVNLFGLSLFSHVC